METKIKNKEADCQIYTEENKHTFPKEIREAFEYIKNNKSKVLEQTKYYEVQKDIIQRKLNEFFKTNPDARLPEVVFQAINHLPDIVPADKIVELTDFALKNWLKTVNEKNEVTV